jgi:hypothetical protein
MTNVRSPSASFPEHSRRVNFFLEVIRRNRKNAK